MRPSLSLFALATTLAAGTTRAQTFVVLDAAPPDVGPAYSVPGPRPSASRVVAVDHDQLACDMDRAPDEIAGGRLAEYGLLLSLPAPDGRLVPCRVARSAIMEPGLAAQFPQFGSFLVAADDNSFVGRLELSPRGLTGMLRALSGTSGDTWMIDPWRSADPTLLITYRLGDLAAPDWTCHTVPASSPERRDDAQAHEPADGFTPRALQSTRTNLLAMACTGEYGLYHSSIQGHAPNAADPLAAILTVVGRTNVVFENDLAVRFLLVSNNAAITYFNPDTDPFPTTCDGLGGSDCSGPIHGTLGTVLDTVIGSGNFQAGHCLTRIAGGVANLPGACGGRGVSGIPRGGDIDPFAANVVIHELGHQFGAGHTFSGTRGRCGNNASLNSAWEAGSGSSPMAYAGGCPVGNAPPSDNIVQFADPFFHHGSLEQMQAYLPNSCMAGMPSVNSLPVITSITPDQSIPPGTPFLLSVSASDADADLLTYSWEQFDNGIRRPLSGAESLDNGFGSLFRIFPPTFDTSRSFPQIADVLSGVATPGEQLPSVPTTAGSPRKFRVAVRDNRAGMGAAVISSTVRLDIPAGASPFAVTSPTVGDTRSGTATVTWSVGNTNAAPINAAAVAIRLSTDDGLTFPHPLGTFPNTGSALVIMPAISSTSARIRLDPVGRIFYAISRPFLLAGCPADFNRDGFLDGFDYDAFVQCFEGDPCPSGLSADFNLDGFTDGFDYDDFVAAFEQGC